MFIILVKFTPRKVEEVKNKHYLFLIDFALFYFLTLFDVNVYFTSYSVL